MQRDNQYIVAFVDILGFSKSIRDYDSGENPELLNQIKEAVNSAGELLTKIYVKPSNVVLEFPWDRQELHRVVCRVEAQKCFWLPLF